MAIAHPAREHVDQFHAGVTKLRVRHRIVPQRDQIRLDDHVALHGIAEQIVTMTGLGPAALDPRALPRLHEGAMPALFAFRKQARDRHIETGGKRLERGERGGDGAVLDFGHHAGRDAGGGAKFGDREIKRFAQAADLRTDRDLERSRCVLGRCERAGQQGRFGRGGFGAAFDRRPFSRSLLLFPCAHV
jgi:hypothetical protein